MSLELSRTCAPNNPDLNCVDTALGVLKERVYHGREFDAVDTLKTRDTPTLTVCTVKLLLLQTLCWKFFWSKGYSTTFFANYQPGSDELIHVMPGNMLPATSNMLPATKLLPVCWPSVAVYKGIQKSCCRDTDMLPGVNAGYKVLRFHWDKIDIMPLVTYVVYIKYQKY